MKLQHKSQGNCFTGLLFLLYTFRGGRIIISRSYTRGIPHFLLRVGTFVWHFTPGDENDQSSHSSIIDSLWYKGQYKAIHWRHYERWARGKRHFLLFINIGKGKA